MPDADQNKKILELAADVRKFEIDLFWKRSTFFWAFSTTAIGAYGVSPNGSGRQFAAGCFGLVCAAIWSLVNRGSKYWQEVWEKKVEVHQRDAIGLDLFSERSNPKILQSFGWRPMHYSVSALASQRLYNNSLDGLDPAIKQYRTAHFSCIGGNRNAISHRSLSLCRFVHM
ncbi:MAG: RipA family octameric membrane protein [Rhodoplanes sp.]